MIKLDLVGSSLYSCFAALFFREKYGDQIDLTIHEQGSDLLRPWKAVNIGEFRFNNGFHGIELPRATELFEYLSANLGSERFKRVANRRGLAIEGFLVDFRDRFELWPEKLKSSVLDNSIYKVFEACSVRYDDRLVQCMHQFVPWFMPSDIPFLGDDEGSVFQNKVRRRQVENPEFALPVSGIFEDLIEPFQELLDRKNIRISTNSKIGLADLGKSTANRDTGNNRIFYASSLAPLYVDLSKSGLLPVRSTRHLFNILVSLDSDVTLTSQYSEILVADSGCPRLARITTLLAAESGGAPVLQLEYLSERASLREEELEKVIAVVSRLFEKTPRVIGWDMSRRMFNITEYDQENAWTQIKEAVSAYKQIIPRPYWYPINMNKCYEFAREDVEVF